MVIAMNPIKRISITILAACMLLCCISCSGTTQVHYEMFCTLSIECSSIIANIDSFKYEKCEILPLDGVILPETCVGFSDGESVYDVLVRETRNRNIHMESEYTPIYDSAYIEGIANIYEFDCGSSSGWTYSVNGEFPNYGCSGYILKDGDVIEWHYSCNYGSDIEENK